MIIFLFVIFMLAVFGRLSVFAVRAAWNIGKILFSILFLPIVLILLFCKGLIIFALIALAAIGLLTIIRPAKNPCRL